MTSGGSDSRFPSVTRLLAVLGLLVIGTIFVHSATAGGTVGFPGDDARHHIIRIALGLGILWLLLRIDYRHLETLAWPLYLAGIGSLLLLLALKLQREGVVRWIRLPGFSLQPSEPMKLFTILLLARCLKPTREAPSELRQWQPLAVALLPVILVALQPDLGTALVIPPALVAMLWVSGISKRRLFSYFALAVSLLPLLFFALKPYQRVRLVAFVNPEAKVNEAAAYQLKQSLTAIGSGGPTGKGLGLGSMNYLDLLPESHNDFIFAVIGEEWGLWGTLLVTGLFAVLYLTCLGVAYRTREPYGRLVVVGITVQLAFQTVVNLAMTLGLAPVTGLPLPFISYGGSSLLASLASIGVILGIEMRPVRILNPDGLRAGSALRPD